MNDAQKTPRCGDGNFFMMCSIPTLFLSLRRRRYFSPLVFFGLALQLVAVDVNWQSSTNGVTLTSENQAMNASFFFELGSFQPDFTPTGVNMSEWLVRHGSPNWTRASGTAHSSVFRGFAGNTYSYTANRSPFLTTNQAYVLGYNGSIAQGEWILLTNPSWFWPQANPDDFFPLPTFWDTTQLGTTAIVGGISVSAESSTIRSARFTTMTPPRFDYTGWRPFVFSPAQISNSVISDPTADPDTDGANNAVEFACGTSPLSSQSVPQAGISLVQTTTVNGTGRFVFASWPRDQRALSATPYYQYSANLVSWSSSTPEPLSGPLMTLIATSTTVDTWSVRTTHPITNLQPQAFLRLLGFSID